MTFLTQGYDRQRTAFSTVLVRKPWHGGYWSVRSIDKHGVAPRIGLEFTQQQQRTVRQVEVYRHEEHRI